MKTKTNITLRTIPVSPNDDYLAGEDGLIYSRTKYKGFGKKEYVDWYPLKGHRTGKGYVLVSLCHNNQKVTKSVHRLVCLAFHGTPKPASLQVRHLNGNPDDNRPENLAWGTQQENWLDRKAHGRGIEGEKHHASKFTNKERERICWAVEKGLCSQRHAARMLNVSQATISRIVDSKWGRRCG